MPVDSCGSGNGNGSGSSSSGSGNHDSTMQEGCRVGRV